MAGIIKNQILKHLSRYVKKLSSDRINVSTLKGEGELTDLELDEEVMTELLALPIWMKIKKANCNRARIMIQWTKLKSIPIRLILDTIEIQIEACEELRPVVTVPSSHLTLPSAGKYGFVNKVVDGITVTVESVEIKFCSKAFESKVQISRIRVESKSPQWKKVELPHTRLKDLEKGELLTFKEIEWQTLRLEAQSTKEKHLAPLRLLANQTKARIVIKKKLSDCTVIGCRLSLILDDLLWVLTDSQILAAAHFMNSLSGLVKQATEMVQSVKAARKLENLYEYRAQQVQANSQNRTLHSESSRIFDAFDVKETSYHLMCDKIDLHFCDDAGVGRSNHPDLCDGGAGQVQLTQFIVDFYPYHLAKADRRHWHRYFNNDLNHWLKEALKSFHGQMMDLFPRSTGGSNLSSPMENENFTTPRKYSSPTSDIISSRLSDQLSKLMSTCLVVKIRDILMYKVTTSSKETPMPFISSYFDRPKDISAVNMEFTWFYNPGGVSFPCPSPKFYTQVNPLQIHLDVCTILWLNSFLSNIQSTIPQPNAQPDVDYLDVRLELIMPKVIFEEKISYPAYKERPTAFQIQASRIIVSNYRSSETGTRAQLATTIDEIERHNGFNAGENGIPQVPSKFILHSKGKDHVREGRNDSIPLTTDMLWTEARDVWCIAVDTIWADFCVDPKFKNEFGSEGEPKRKFRSSTTASQSESLLLPFVDSVPLSIWLYCEEELIDPEFSMGKRKDIKAILQTDGMCNIQLTHQQYLFLLRAAEAISEISLFLTIDTRKTYIVSRRDDSVQLSGCLPRLEISFILPYMENSDIQRENSSLNDIEQPTTDPLSPARTNKLQEQVTSWNMAEDKHSKVNAGEVPDSPEKFYNDFATCGTPSFTPADSIKSSFTQEMKQGISNIVVSFTKAGGQSTPDSEVTSMWSTDSSENNFITLDPDQELPSPYQQEETEEIVEVAEEVIEDNSQSTGSFSIHNPYGKEDTIEINVLTVSLNDLLIGQQSEGLSSSISLLCKTLSVEECGQIPWKDFQTLFATRGKKWRTDNERRNFLTEANNAISLKFTQRIDDITFMNCLTADEMINALKQVKTSKCPRVNLIDRPGPESPIRKAINQSTHPRVTASIDFCEGKANEGQFITLHSSLLKSAADFFEDELPPNVLPMEIRVVGASVEILEDKGPNYPSTRVRLQDSIRIIRNEEGVFSIGCPCKKQLKSKICNGRDVSSVSMGDSMYDFKKQIMQLRQQVSDLEKDKSSLLNELQQLQKKT